MASTRLAISFSAVASLHLMLAAVVFGAADSRAVSAATSAPNTLTGLARTNSRLSAVGERGSYRDLCRESFQDFHRGHSFLDGTIENY